MLKKTLILTTAISGFAMAAQAQELNILDWGGAYGASHQVAYIKPYEAATGTKISVADADNPATPIKAQVESGNVTADIASVEYADAVRLCDEGLLEEIDLSILAPGSDGVAAEDDFFEGTLSECFVATDVFTTILAYDDSRFPEAKPEKLADFFDLDKFPGKRGMRKGPKVNLEMALIADGVPVDEVYETLSTPEGLDRAFAKLDTIKSQIVWWEAGAQPPQLLADGEVQMTIAYNGRIFNAAVDENKPFKIVWDGQVYEFEGWVVPKGAPNKDVAMDFITFSTGSEPLARAAEQISYGPPRASSQSLVGNYKDTDIAMQPNLPTSPENMSNALLSDVGFWVDHDSELTERFNAWLAS
ncbi:MAG: ABC transporter substrate-binding protein [Paracoccus sp. (in: a-proteobacteria)]|uniref:ABC transporter substrate-binding protein n=1 Tax=Paracoccus sp. TaxID=267 RepID=UPI0026DEE46A|nr:ABC transporter substrate-binding protein [Paracoccus sp. (in: a-proteobacteria)]MDO5621880.1 ABC transporter substrate-binding protein [Paracoccus sp. (in: a-proteobacteria)]